MLGSDPDEGLLEGFSMPAEIADGICADSPGAEDQGASRCSNSGRSWWIRRLASARVFQMQMSPERIGHVEATAFTDVEDESSELGEIIEHRPDQLAEVDIECGEKFRDCGVVGRSSEVGNFPSPNWWFSRSKSLKNSCGRHGSRWRLLPHGRGGG